VNRILKAAAPLLRVGIILLVQTGGRTYSEGFRLRWDQVDWERRLIRFGSDVRTPGSSEPLRLTDLAYQVLLKWKEGSGSDLPCIFASPRQPGQPIRSAKNRVAGHTEASRRAAFSDLQLTECFLYAATLGCA
jgi:integrase